MRPRVDRASIEATGSVAQALRRAAERFTGSALRALNPSEPSDNAVHQARKQLKRARTALRLLRPALTGRVYRRENMLLREIAHSLNAVRDATVLPKTLASLLQTQRALRCDAQVAHLRRTLREDLAEQRRRLRRPLSALVQARSTLERTGVRVARWHLGADDWLLLGPALRGIYRKGRRARPDPSSAPGSAALHEWRKQTKYLRYALEIVAPMRPHRLARLSRQAKQLTDWLGDAHDLVMLARKVRSLRQPKSAGLRRLLTLCKRRRKRLERKAMARGKELYAPKPRDWAVPLEGYWTRWRRTD